MAATVPRRMLSCRVTLYRFVRRRGRRHPPKPGDGLRSNLLSLWTGRLYAALGASDQKDFVERRNVLGAVHTIFAHDATLASRQRTTDNI